MPPRREAAAVILTILMGRRAAMETSRRHRFSPARQPHPALTRSPCRPSRWAGSAGSRRTPLTSTPWPPAFQMGGLGGLVSNTFNFTTVVAGAAQTGTSPAFSTQPAAQSVAPGVNVTLTAAASGTPAPSYQWKKDGADIAGATSATLTLT